MKNKDIKITSIENIQDINEDDKEEVLQSLLPLLDEDSEIEDIKIMSIENIQNINKDELEAVLMTLLELYENYDFTIRRKCKLYTYLQKKM